MGSVCSCLPNRSVVAPSSDDGGFKDVLKDDPFSLTSSSSERKETSGVPFLVKDFSRVNSGNISLSLSSGGPTDQPSALSLPPIGSSRNANAGILPSPLSKFRVLRRLADEEDTEHLFKSSIPQKSRFDVGMKLPDSPSTPSPPQNSIILSLPPDPTADLMMTMPQSARNGMRNNQVKSSNGDRSARTTTLTTTTTLQITTTTTTSVSLPSDSEEHIIDALDGAPAAQTSSRNNVKGATGDMPGGQYLQPSDTDESKTSTNVGSFAATLPFGHIKTAEGIPAGAVTSYSVPIRVTPRRFIAISDSIQSPLSPSRSPSARSSARPSSGTHVIGTIQEDAPLPPEPPAQQSPPPSSPPLSTRLVRVSSQHDALLALAPPPAAKMVGRLPPLQSPPALPASKAQHWNDHEGSEHHVDDLQEASPKAQQPPMSPLTNPLHGLGTSRSAFRPVVTPRNISVIQKMIPV
mmetsp:Transcript_15540/g.25712  ORF Transcript_15540/g.25712 Transcript_15540/m.25712 type:complete len:463 (+) Transcript_15540:185-1573(+)|eukprot:CAMPEP_0184660154 /NCGR_PEP_ID=MMETSP0308-20130426/32644_1 /TAXON_ID=38269 /ORGANISM="Gloeochaete witrockiana, Strain SAG 46.84" /LENGTH=462 /DNA_ID=CAMNT_0027100527 /DNA_START=86 /DNA_END=1474 /DNA_ORIENTATION=-